MRTKLLYLLLSVIGLCSCSSTSTQKHSQTNNAKPGKSLVVFFSWSGNTRAVARAGSTPLPRLCVLSFQKWTYPERR